MIIDGYEDPFIAARTAHAHEKAWITLLVDQPVAAAFHSDVMEEDFRRPVAGVDAGVEEPVIGGAPNAGAAGIGNPVIKIAAADNVPDTQREELGAHVVEGPEQAAVVGRMIDPADPEIGLAFGFVIAVKDDLLRASVAGRSEITRLLAAKLEGRSIGIRPVLHRHGAVVFLDSPFHFRKERLSQLGRIVHEGRLIGVLGFQVGADCRIEGCRIPEDLLPVLRPQPRIFVDARDVVPRIGVRPALGLRRGQ